MIALQTAIRYSVGKSAAIFDESHLSEKEVLKQAKQLRFWKSTPLLEFPQMVGRPSAAKVSLVGLLTPFFLRARVSRHRTRFGRLSSKIIARSLSGTCDKSSA
jgi:hypothetical protein